MIKYTELKAKNRKTLIDVLPLKKPFTVLIEPTSLCNFRCVQCFQSMVGDNYFFQNQMNMPIACFKEIIEQIRAWPGDKIKVVKLSLYGEPLINPQFCEMLKIAKEFKVAERIETTTNASLLTRDIAEKLVEYQLDYIRVSIYATNQQEHQARTGSNIEIGIIHENLRTLQGIKRKAGSERPFIAVKMLDSYKEENDLFRRIYQDVADEIYLDKPHGWIEVDSIDFIKNYYQDDDSEAKDDLSRTRTTRTACPMAFTTMAIRSNGAVSPCCVDFIGGTNLGHVGELNLKEIWQSDDWYKFQKKQLQGRKNENFSCARCDIFQSNHYTLDNIDGFPIEKLRI